MAVHKPVMDLGCSQRAPPKRLGSGKGLPKASRLAFVDVPRPGGETGWEPGWNPGYVCQLWLCNESYSVSLAQSREHVLLAHQSAGTRLIWSVLSRTCPRPWVHCRSAPRFLGPVGYPGLAPLSTLVRSSQGRGLG